MDFRNFIPTLALLALGGLGGFLASLTVMPLPWMLGALLATASFTIARPEALPHTYKFPMFLRMLFIAVIGVMIGAQVTPELVARAPLMVMSLIGLSVFVPLGFAANLWIFRRLGGYDSVTAFFCSAPGGLMESITMGEAHGCNIKLLTVQQFLRIIVVIMLVPMLMSVWIGAPLGSAAGVQITSGVQADITPEQVLIGAGVVLIGLVFGLKLKIPAGQLMGPLLIAAAVNLSGLATLQLPEVLIITAQLVIGTALGSRFAGLKRDMLVRGIALSFASVTAMLLIALAICLILRTFQPLPFDVLLISFAPGGLTEMSLIALSLNANPALVSLHHMYRIILTVFALHALQRHLPSKG
ncbi:MAG: AbrB family transcriptional regulator [Marinovum sp.]|nr:AbrB family transcriptional regulator [Marinovum sp.]MBT7907674.1 AbrB family transcriptional regulator [Marinovum sp.]